MRMDMMLKKIVLCLQSVRLILALTQCGFWMAAVQLDAQTPEKPSSLVVQVKLVQMDCIVEDEHGAPVHGLTAKDFHVSQEGQPVSVRYLRTDHNVPLSVALLVDISASQNGMLGIYSDAVRSLKENLVPGRDRVSVYSFGSAVSLLSDWQDVSAVDPDSIQHLTSKSGTALLRKHKFLAGGTRLFDAVNFVSERMKGLEGRKAILVLTDGIDMGSSIYGFTVAKHSEQANVSVSALEFLPKDVLSYLDPYSFAMKSAHDGLAGIGHDTGGVFLHAHRKKAPEQIRQIVALLKEDYVVYFTPLDSTRNFHPVAVTISRADVHLFTRKGFYEPATK